MFNKIIITGTVYMMLKNKFLRTNSSSNEELSPKSLGFTNSVG